MIVVSVDYIDQDNGGEVHIWISDCRAIAGLTFSFGVLIAANLLAKLRQHPALVREVDTVDCARNR